MSRTLSRSDDNSSVELAVGETFDVALEENPTTGYRWSVETSPPDALVLDGDEFSAAGAGIGAGGQRRFRFRAARAGTFTLSCRNARPWEPAATSMDTFRVTGAIR